MGRQRQAHGQRLCRKHNIRLRTLMKKDIHPEYHTATVTCSCGNTFVTGATKPALRVEICSNCHPFYTGQQRVVDTEGRIERLKRRFNLQ